MDHLKTTRILLLQNAEEESNMLKELSTTFTSMSKEYK